MNPATEIFSYRDGDGHRQLAVLSPLGLTGMSLVQTIPTGLILQETYFFVRLWLPIALGVLVLGLFIALFLYHSINRPVEKLGRQFKAIAGGDFAANPEIEWDNEFGEIGRGVNKLASDVESLMESRIEDEKRKRDLEYKMLQNQINPHFLYNTLNSIKWMATIQKADGIAEMTTSLARLLRSIAKINQSLVPLSQELALLEDYFVISRYRYGGSITTHIEVPEALLDCYIPVFTLQPIVENSIFHGIEPNGGIGSVSVRAERIGDVLEITVEDDGIGMEDEKITKLFEADEADNHALFREIGIFNVHARIRHEFGSDYGLNMISKQGKFTRAIVRLPIT
jgi:two-component system sensor histidine kinase YesM